MKLAYFRTCKLLQWKFVLFIVYLLNIISMFWVAKYNTILYIFLFFAFLTSIDFALIFRIYRFTRYTYLCQLKQFSHFRASESLKEIGFSECCQRVFKNGDCLLSCLLINLTCDTFSLNKLDNLYLNKYEVW